MTDPDGATSAAGERPPDPAAVLAETDWGALSHAFGVADDTPRDLVGLLDDDTRVQAMSLWDLDTSVLHEGVPYGAAPPAALYVAGILTHPRTLLDHHGRTDTGDRVRPLRASLIGWLGEFAVAVRGSVTATGARAGHMGPLAVLPGVYAGVRPFLGDRDARVREAAIGTVNVLLTLPPLAGRTAEAARTLAALLDARYDAAPARPRVPHRTPCGGDGGGRRTRAAAVLALGAWNEDTGRWLADRDPAVRACAALGRRCRDDPRATDVILGALREPETADGWFGEAVPPLEGRFRFALVEAAVRCAVPFETLLPAALAVTRVAGASTVDGDWGPLLGVAFPGGHRRGRPLSAAQREFVGALVAVDACWGTPLGNPGVWWGRVGLPGEREALRRLVGEGRRGVSCA